MIEAKLPSQLLRCLFLALTLFAFAPTVRAQAPGARDIWAISRREQEALNAIAAESKGFVGQIQAQFLNERGEVLSDFWSLWRIRLTDTGFQLRDLTLPAATPRWPPAEAAAKPAKKTRSSGRAKPAAQPPTPSLLMEGAAPMITPDIGGLDASRYNFLYDGEEYLGTLRTWKFTLTPKDSAGPGAFAGQIWVADHDIVRFSGRFVNPPSGRTYLSFDSLRYKSAGGRWLPWLTYLDATGLPPEPMGSRALRARITMWGFAKSMDTEGIAKIRTDDSVDASRAAGTPASPEDAYLNADKNFVEWLERTGLMARPGKVERELLNPMLQEIVDTNRIALPHPLTARVLLSVPVETVLFEQTVGISASAIDLAPNNAMVALLLAREVALALIRKHHFDLVWGRPDIQLQDEVELIHGFAFAPTQEELDQAEELAVKFLLNIPRYTPQQIAGAGYFLYAARQACTAIPAMFIPRFGEGLPGCGRSGRISRLETTPPPDNDQSPAMHVSARLELNPSNNILELVGASDVHAPFRIVPPPSIPRLADANADPASPVLPPVPIVRQPPPPILPAVKIK